MAELPWRAAPISGACQSGRGGRFPRAFSIAAAPPPCSPPKDPVGWLWACWRHPLHHSYPLPPSSYPGIVIPTPPLRRCAGPFSPPPLLCIPPYTPMAFPRRLCTALPFLLAFCGLASPLPRRHLRPSPLR